MKTLDALNSQTACAYCSIRAASKGMCSKHYSRFKRHGDATISYKPRGEGSTIGERFWFRTAKQANGCINWTGSVDGSGYALTRLTVNGKRLNRASRVAFYLATGRLPSDCILHTCDNRLCVNPEHLFEGSKLDNHRDMVAKGRQPRGETGGLTKLTLEAVRRIRIEVDAGLITQHELALEYGVTDQAIYNVRKRKTWRHI